MRTKIGAFCMILGAALVLGALTLFLRNQQEAQEAELFTKSVMPVLREEIEQVRQTAPSQPEIPENVPQELLTEEDLAMTEKIINGHPYIGYLTIPELKLELPVMSDGSGNHLQIAPCRFWGTARGEDLVLMAHSMAAHFGYIGRLSEGSQVQFTDMDGIIWNYEVVAKDILAPEAVEEMTAGEYDLTLFTCTSNRTHRITIRCNKLDP